MSISVAWSDPRSADDADPIALLTESLADKDDIIQSQYAELTEARRQLGLMREAVEYWRAAAANRWVSEPIPDGGFKGAMP
jgi:hypothetical protein